MSQNHGGNREPSPGSVGKPVPTTRSTSSCYNRLPLADIPVFDRRPGATRAEDSSAREAATPVPCRRTRPRALLGAAGLAAALAATALFPAAASAFCGFFVSGADAQLYNNASQVALLRSGNHTVMTMSNNYKGPPEDFAMVVPVPVVLHKEQVKTLAADVFQHIDQLSAPRLVEYWEQDPCNPYSGMEYERRKGGPPGSGGGGPRRGAAADYGVTIEDQFTVGEYQIVILSAKDSTGLDRWLRDNKYKIPAGADAALAPYVRDQMKFFVAKVDIKKVKRDAHGAVVLSPLRFGFDAAELRLPVRLGPAQRRRPSRIYWSTCCTPPTASRPPTTPTFLSPPTSKSPTRCATTFRAFTPSYSTRRCVRRTTAPWSPSTPGRPRAAIPARHRRSPRADLYTLGDEQVFPTERRRRRQRHRPTPTGRGMSSGPYFGNSSSWVLTRMHTRYDQPDAHRRPDLPRRQARGRRSRQWRRRSGRPGRPHRGQQASNNFQGRYIIRHYWEAALACEKPVYGVWGGPPGSAQLRRRLQAGKARAGGGSGQRAARQGKTRGGGAVAAAGVWPTRRRPARYAKASSASPGRTPTRRQSGHSGSFSASGSLIPI